MDNAMLQQALNNDPVMHQLLAHKLQNNEPIIIEGLNVCRIVNDNVFKKIDPILNDIVGALASIIKIINKNILEPIDGFVETLIYSLNKAIDLINIFISFKLLIWNSMYKLWKMMIGMNIKLLSGDIFAPLFFIALPQLLILKTVIDNLLIKILPAKYADINIDYIWAAIVYILWLPIAGAIYNIVELLL